jgi:hypothetical protein
MRYRPTNGNIGSGWAGLCSRIFWNAQRSALRAVDQGRCGVGRKRRRRREIRNPGDDDPNHQQPKETLTERAQNRRRLRLLTPDEAVFRQTLAKGFEFRGRHHDSLAPQARCLHRRNVANILAKTMVAAFRSLPKRKCFVLFFHPKRDDCLPSRQTSATPAYAAHRRPARPIRHFHRRPRC